MHSQWTKAIKLYNAIGATGSSLLITFQFGERLDVPQMHKYTGLLKRYTDFHAKSTSTTLHIGALRRDMAELLKQDDRRPRAKEYGWHDTLTQAQSQSFLELAKATMLERSRLDKLFQGLIDEQSPDAEAAEKPQADTPENPEADTPENPEADTPENPEADTPENPEADTPEKPHANSESVYKEFWECTMELCTLIDFFSALATVSLFKDVEAADDEIRALQNHFYMRDSATADERLKPASAILLGAGAAIAIPTVSLSVLRVLGCWPSVVDMEGLDPQAVWGSTYIVMSYFGHIGLVLLSALMIRSGLKMQIPYALRHRSKVDALETPASLKQLVAATLGTGG